MQKSFSRKDSFRQNDSNRMKFAFCLNRVEPVCFTLHRSGCKFRDDGLLLLIHPVSSLIPGHADAFTSTLHNARAYFVRRPNDAFRRLKRRPTSRPVKRIGPWLKSY